MTAAEHAENVRLELGDSWLPRIYQRILKMRTRAYHFGDIASRNRVKVQHSLLGVELKIGRRRLLCPDLATAQYLSIFARLGCKDVAVPYDITRISALVSELESSWQRMFLMASKGAADRKESFRVRIRGLLIAKIRQEILELGAGPKAPEFRRSLKQRRNN